MATMTKLSVGDNFTYTRITSHRDETTHLFGREGHYTIGLGTKECDINGVRRSCPVCYDQWAETTSTIMDIKYFADNSIEVYLANGEECMVKPPSGDRV